MDNTSAPPAAKAPAPVVEPVPTAWHFAALLAGNVALALGPWMVRLADTGPVSAAFWRIALALPVIALLAWRERRKAGGGRPPRGLVLLVLGAGAFFAVDLGSWHTGIEMTRLGNATLFGNAGSLILMLWSIAVVRRMPQRLEWLAVAMALAGAAILLGRSLQISAQTLAGDVFCIVAGICYAFYLLPAQKARASLGPWQVLLLAGLSAAPLLLLGSIAFGEPVWPRDWTPVLTLAVTSQILGQGLMVYSLRHFSPLVIGVALLTQPAIAAYIGWAAFDEVLSPPDILGMALLAGALLAVKAAGTRPRRALPETS